MVHARMATLTINPASEIGRSDAEGANRQRVRIRVRSRNVTVGGSVVPGVSGGLAATLKRVQAPGGGPVFVGAHRKPDAVVMSVSRYQQLVEAAERRDAVADALVSVRVEGLEPSVEGLALLEAIATGEMNEDQAVNQLRQRYRRWAGIPTSTCRPVSSTIARDHRRRPAGAGRLYQRADHPAAASPAETLRPAPICPQHLISFGDDRPLTPHSAGSAG